jgi:hypothetical protein
MVSRKTSTHHDWLATQLHRRTRELVEFARRNRCGRIEIDATSPPSNLPLFRLLQLVREKSDAYGIVVRVIGETNADADASAAVT